MLLAILVVLTYLGGWLLRAVRHQRRRQHQRPGRRPARRGGAAVPRRLARRVDRSSSSPVAASSPWPRVRACRGASTATLVRGRCARLSRSARGGDQLRDLHGVERGTLAQVVVADEEREPAVVRRRPGPGGAGRRTTGPCRRPSAGSAPRRARRPARRPSSSRARAGVIGRSNSALIASEWPVKTGTRTQMPETSRSGRPRILRDSLRSFCSSSVSLRPSSTIEPASGSTL